MTWTTQSTTTTVWNRTSSTTTAYTADGATEAVWFTPNTDVTIHGGAGTFNVTGQPFNQTRIYFNRTLSNGQRDFNWLKPSINQTAWRQQ